MSLRKSPQPYLSASPRQGGGREIEKASDSDIEPETSQDKRPSKK